MKKLHLKSILLLVVLICMGCSADDDALIDPKSDILGKWEYIADSFGPVSASGTYKQFMQDSILYIYNSENDFSYSKYWLNTSNDTLFIDNRSFKFEFLNRNKLQLDILQPAVITRSIYKRID